MTRSGGGRMSRYGALARRGASVALSKAREEKHTFIALGVAGAAGYARGKGMLDNIPHVQQLGVVGTFGIAAWALGKYTNNRIARHAATGLLAIAVNRFAEAQARSGGGAVQGEVEYRD